MIVVISSIEEKKRKSMLWMVLPVTLGNLEQMFTKHSFPEKHSEKHTFITLLIFLIPLFFFVFFTLTGFK